jgi:hypothetical protein
VVAHAVAVLDSPGENVGDGLDTAMRMPGEPGEVIFWNIIAKVVEQKEGIEFMGVPEAKSAAEMDAGALEGGLGLNESLYGSYRHEVLPAA